MKTAVLSLVAAAALSVPSTYASVVSSRDSKITPITVKGNAFFKGNERFYIRGLDYQPGGSSKVEDPIAEPDTCKRDIEYFKELGLNTIRIYTVDNSKNHDECMKALADAGIYLVLDVNTPKYSINRAEPEISYNDVYLQNVFATVEMFAKYDNTLAFFSGNEVINDGETSNTAPYVKAVTRDVRQFIRSRGLRKVPVGYSAADIDTNRLEMAQYMNCGPDDERSDFFAFNDYSWCDPSSFTTSGWDQKVKNFTGYGLPLFLSEYGCNTNKRGFGEVKALYSEKMTPVYSGGLVYEYTQEPSNYGLVDLGGDKPKKLDDFDTLKKAFAGTKNPSGDGGYNSTGGANPCPKKNAPNWDVDDDALPAIPEPAKKYMKDGPGKGPGLSGKGSQNAGTKSSGTATPGSGSVTATSSSSQGAAAGLRIETSIAPMVCAMLVVISTMFGASFIFMLQM
ncbi:glycolipid-anchored surface protein 5 [Uncinocarpus reesii 1704]|uniref:1,3-beta-glucanosyltransferase n=1 Tax=Uncinocarpus reesii (strain UAMH 1704) TaxID=336963 RepID=C4JD86_UNCRE|nr:glycolipid-anchored surface protein 5 [Uncinocarpus reesii 1704]EEP75440.1 glycolipid-anchored surface protein 5 [Uncinocarpus reesii 1704]